MKKQIINVFIAAAVLSALIGCGGRQVQNSSADHSAVTSTAAGAAKKEKEGSSVQAGGTQTPKETASTKSNAAQDPKQSAESVTSAQPATEQQGAEQQGAEQQAAEEPVEEEVKEKMLKMMIGDTEVSVDWENNESAEALKDLCAEEPLVIQMSMYGGFEQVGSIGTRLPSDDEQTSTSAGDIVLYSSNQIVVFYGSNSWAYTRLGHITDQDAAGMTDLLGNGDVTITISLEDAE